MNETRWTAPISGWYSFSTGPTPQFVEQGDAQRVDWLSTERTFSVVDGVTVETTPPQAEPAAGKWMMP